MFKVFFHWLLSSTSHKFSKLFFLQNFKRINKFLLSSSPFRISKTHQKRCQSLLDLFSVCIWGPMQPPWPLDPQQSRICGPLSFTHFCRKRWNTQDEMPDSIFWTVLKKIIQIKALFSAFFQNVCQLIIFIVNILLFISKTICHRTFIFVPKWG